MKDNVVINRIICFILEELQGSPQTRKPLGKRPHNRCHMSIPSVVLPWLLDVKNYSLPMKRCSSYLLSFHELYQLHSRMDFRTHVSQTHDPFVQNLCAAILLTKAISMSIIGSECPCHFSIFLSHIAHNFPSLSDFNVLHIEWAFTHMAGGVTRKRIE